MKKRISGNISYCVGSVGGGRRGGIPRSEEIDAGGREPFRGGPLVPLLSSDWEKILPDDHPAMAVFDRK